VAKRDADDGTVDVPHPPPKLPVAYSNRVKIFLIPRREIMWVPECRRLWQMASG